MHFAEAEKRYRELDEKLVRGELTEEEFLRQVGELRLVDESGRRWMVSGRTGRWLVHDGRQWVFAEPPRPQGEAKAEAETETGKDAQTAIETEAEAGPEDIRVPVGAPPKSPSPKPPHRRLWASRLLMAVIAAILFLACLAGGGIVTWVYVLRNLGESDSVPTTGPAVAQVHTFTPRPATATYTPTSTPTASRTATPTRTPIATDTPIATSTPTATRTPVATATRRPASPTPSREPTRIAPTATATAAPAATSATTTALASSETYTVRAGDTLSEIASRLGVSAQALADANGITNPALIRPGQVLIVPRPGTVSPPPTSAPTVQTYTVQRGDTLYGIALRFGLTTQALAEANGITNTALIRPGQVLVIPVPGTTPTTLTPAPTPTWTPIALATRAGTVTSMPVTTARTPTPTPTAGGPTATPQSTNTPRPTAAPTVQAAALSGKIAFSVWNPFINKYEVYVSRIDGSGRNMLGQGFRQPQFRQDGNLLAVNGDGAPNLEHLVTMNPSGGDKLEVSQHTEDAFPTWSPDGAIVSFSSSSWGDGKVRLGIVHDMFGKQQNWIPVGNLQIEGNYPFWMADGRIVYHGCDFLSGGGNCGLYWVGAGGGSYHRVSNHESDTAPAGSGTRVAFMSARDGNWEIYVVDMNGGALTRLTNNGAQDGLPSWSPDGKFIAFVSNRGGVWAIWVMNADGSNQRKLFDLGGGYGSGERDWTTERISWAP